MRTLFTTTIFALGLIISGTAIAAGDGDLSSLSEGITSQLASLVGLLKMTAYVAGVGFSLMGVIQFKAHKDNPQQVPLSKPIVYLIIGACLLFLPSIMDTAGATIFGGEAKSANVSESL